MINNDRLKRLLKSKDYEKMSLEELMEAYITLYIKNAHKNMNELLDELLIYIEKAKDTFTRDAILSAIEDATKNLNFPIPQGVITLILQEKIAASVAIMSPSKLSQELIKPSFGQAFTPAIESLSKRMSFVGDDASNRVQNKLKEIYTKAMEGDLTEQELFQTLRENFESYRDLEEYRLRAAVDFTLRQNRNLGVLTMAKEYGYKYVQVEAIIDERTTPICVSMHQRIIPVDELMTQYKNLLSAQSVDEVKSASNLTLDDKGFWKKKMPSNFGVPPYHFGCRTTIRLLSDYEYKSLQNYTDEFGKVYSIRGGADGEIWEKIRKKDGHLPRSGYKTVPELLQTTLGKISRVASHKNKEGFVIQGKNGFLVFMNYKGEIESCFKPEIGTSKYFDKYALVTYYDSLFLKRVKKWLGL
ncbi:MAG: hypothetical protein ACK5LP_07765 [Campylobacteraceae bacterium]